MKPEPSIRKTWWGAAEGAVAWGMGCGCETTASMISSTGVLYSDISLFRGRRRAGRGTFRLGLHRAVDEQPGAIRALDLPGGSKVEIDPRVPEGGIAAVASGDSFVDVDGLEGAHMRPVANSARKRARLTLRPTR